MSCTLTTSPQHDETEYRHPSRLHLVTLTLTGAAGTILQTTQLTDLQREILAAGGVEPPPRITALQPA